jgi:hypothetical protein
MADEATTFRLLSNCCAVLLSTGLLSIYFPTSPDAPSFLPQDIAVQ